MIHDVDESLRALVRRDALNGSAVEVAFDAPTKDWVARRNAPTVDLYLYDIREDLMRREVAWEPVRDSTGRVTERRPPARRYRLSYLVTAWTQRPEDEHRLLSALLGCFVRHELMPRDVMVAPLAEQPLPVYLTVALPPPEDRSFADVWSALGGELKPSLDLVVIAPLDTRLSQVAGPPVLEEPRISIETPEGNGEKPTPRRRRAAPTAEPVPEPIQDELVAAGRKAQPGRTFRVRGIGRRSAPGR